MVIHKILGSPDVMDVVSLHLDRSNCPGKRKDFLTPAGWEKLADQYNVPKNLKSQCRSAVIRNPSPSDAMFKYLESTGDSLNIGVTKTHLRKLGRNDIIDYINEVMVKDRDRLSGKLSEVTQR